MKSFLRKSISSMLIFTMFTTSSTFIVNGAETTPVLQTKYNKVEEIFDWGAATTKVIVNLNENVKSGSVDKDTFTVDVIKTDERVTQEPLSEEGQRIIKDAYVSDENGNKTENGSYATIEMKVAPNMSLGSPLNYYEGRNVWIDCDYTIKQAKDIVSGDTKISGLEAKTLDKRNVLLVDDFKLNKITYKDENFGNIIMSYASFAPKKDNIKNPLIIWLHGGGEGGTDATIPISANKAANFASSEIQSYFKGGYVLAPQSPTRWMDDGSGEDSGAKKTNADSMYTDSLMNLIKTYVKQNPDIDKDRIYIGGCSNGGFMTLRMLLDYPEYFAAAFPICEGMNDKYITDSDIQKIKDIPMWFVCAVTDDTLDPNAFTLPTYKRLIDSGAKNTYLKYYDNVVDTTGLYKDENGKPYEYDGHWSWIYLYNNDVSGKVNGKDITIMEWLASQSK